MDLLKFLLRPLFAKEIQEEQNKRYLQLERNGILKNQLIEAEKEINRLNNCNERFLKTINYKPFLNYSISKTKENPMMATNTIIKASIFRMPFLIKKSSKKVSKTVIKTPSRSGMSNNKLIPMAIPSTSARSQAAMAVSTARLSSGESCATRMWQMA